jgi:hypothetical protein
MVRTLVGIVAVFLGAAILLYVWGTPRVEAPIVGNYSWQFTELSESIDVPGMPRTGVALLVGDAKHEIGEFDGSCAAIKGSGWELLEGEKTGAICWWAGGGSEIGVFIENNKDVVKVGTLDEGSAEVPGFRGDFKKIFEL